MNPRRTLDEVAETLGLTVERTTRREIGRADGRVGGRRVTIENDPGSVAVTAVIRTDQRVVLRAFGGWSDREQAGVRTGHEVFDGLVVIESATGDHRRHSPEGLWASAVLDLAMRREVGAVVAGARGVHEHGAWTVPLDWNATAAQTVERIRAVVALTDRMAAPPDLPGALRERALRDPEDGVRALAADRLLTWLADQPRRDDAFVAELEAALPPGVARARAARLRGAAGEPTLRALLGHDDPSARAEAALGLIALGDRVEGALIDLVPHGDLRVVKALATTGTVAAVPALRALAGSAEQVEAARDAVRVIQSRAVGAERGALAVAPPARSPRRRAGAGSAIPSGAGDRGPGVGSPGAAASLDTDAPVTARAQPPGRPSPATRARRGPPPRRAAVRRGASRGCDRAPARSPGARGPARATGPQR